MDIGDGDSDPLDGFVLVTMERLILAHLDDALGQLRRASGEPMRLFLSARSVHLAMVTALTAALSGTDGTGALRERERRQWLEFHQNGGFASGQSPPKYMASPAELLTRAQTAPVGWLTEPLVLADDEKADLAVLTAMRDWAEHPRPDWHFYEPVIIKAALGIGVKLADMYAKLVAHRYELTDKAALDAMLAELRREIGAL